MLAAAQVWASLRPVAVLLPEESLTSDAVEVLRRAGVQAILAMGGTPSQLVPTALINFTSVGRLAGEHLASKGHRHIAVLVPRNPRILPLGLQRLQGVEEVGRRHGSTDRAGRSGLRFRGSATAGGALAPGSAANRRFHLQRRLRHVVDARATGCGFRIPDQVALVGCDDLPICDLLRPRLTSIRTGPAEYSGKLLAEFPGRPDSRHRNGPGGAAHAGSRADRPGLQLSNGHDLPLPFGDPLVFAQPTTGAAPVIRTALYALPARPAFLRPTSAPKFMIPRRLRACHIPWFFQYSCRPIGGYTLL